MLIMMIWERVSWSYVYSSLTVLSVPKAALAAFYCQQVALPECFEQFLFFHCDLRFLKKARKKEQKERREGGRETKKMEVSV